MAKILTGVQSTGTPHLENLRDDYSRNQLSNDPKNESFLFYCRLTFHNTDKKRRTFRTIIAQHWLACGLDVNKVVSEQTDAANGRIVLKVFDCFSPGDSLLTFILEIKQTD
jgi:tryptophanyl-tRNA synthetase